MHRSAHSDTFARDNLPPVGDWPDLLLDGFDYPDRLNAAVDALDEAGAAALLLAILRNDMQVILERYVSAQRQQVVAAFENWWDKYRVTLTDIERDRDAAAGSLTRFLSELRYA